MFSEIAVPWRPIQNYRAGHKARRSVLARSGSGNVIVGGGKYSRRVKQGARDSQQPARTRFCTWEVIRDDVIRR